LNFILKLCARPQFSSSSSSSSPPSYLNRPGIFSAKSLRASLHLTATFPATKKRKTKRKKERTSGKRLSNRIWKLANRSALCVIAQD
jgi:hypothetical protein